MQTTKLKLTYREKCSSFKAGTGYGKKHEHDGQTVLQRVSDVMIRMGMTFDRASSRVALAPEYLLAAMIDMRRS